MPSRSWPVALVIACAPPPPVPGAGGALAIELLSPEPGEEVELDEDCELNRPIVVHVAGLDLVAPQPDDVVEGQGHWHGGPDLGAGYCVSFDNACDDYDGSGIAPGLLTLFVQLQDNAHEPLGPMDQVEISVVAPDGLTCP